jgi:uroporphyrinogen III methyltransferase/synthase
VILVGAGPGDPGLLTLRGDAALRVADAVVYDALVAPELLERAPLGALRIGVGRRGHETPARSQEDINRLLVDLAREGRTVVRLKGGDPFVFGRGGEEATACREAGIPFEVVPGVSSPIGVLAYAGIPVTDRRHAASFAVVTGHKDPSRPRQETRWEALARAADTLVVLMGMRNLAEIVERLLAGGRPPHTPAAVVMDGTTPRQRSVVGPLAGIAERAREAGLAAPAVLVVGDVVKLRGELAWFESRPLFGQRILVTRSEEQAGPWVEALRAAGAEVVKAPAIRVLAVAADQASAADAALARLADYDLLVFASANAVRFLAERARARGAGWRGLRAEVVCVGPATARAALEAGLPVHGVPERRFDAEGVLETLRGRLELRGRRCLLPRAEAGREVLAEGLRAAGAEVDAVAVYRTVAAEPVAAEAGAPGLRERLVRGELDALTFASPSAARHFAAALDGEAVAAARRCAVVAIGPVTAEALREAGLPPDACCERADAGSLVEALTRVVAAKKGADPA